MDLALFLDQLKLTLYEKEIILYLSSVNSANAKLIYDHTKVPKGRIYSVLHELIQKNFVKVIPSTPKKYQIDDIKKALKRYINFKQSELNERLENVDQLETKPKLFSLDKNDPTVNMFTGRDEHIRAAVALRDAAKKEILQSAPGFKGSYASALSLKKAFERGIKIKLIVREVNEVNKKMIKSCLDNGIEIRENPIALLSLLIVDSKEFLLGVQDYKNEEERMTMYSKNEALLAVLKETHAKFWEKAKPIKKINSN
ncbi:MAG: helix-turn-helix domain-containing protein [Candidatus Woesearchaeota archaeon]